MKLWKKKKDYPADTLLVFREIFNQGPKIAVPTHAAKSVKLRANVSSLTNDLDVGKFELQSFPGYVDNTARLR